MNRVGGRFHNLIHMIGLAPCLRVEILLSLQADFRLEEAPRECRTLFSHADAEARYGASIFWVREGMLPEQMLQEFLATWQTKRDGSRRGIVEVTT